MAWVWTSWFEKENTDFFLSADYKNPFIVFNEELCNIQGYSNWPAAIHQRSQTETSFKIQYEIFFS